MNYLEIVLEGFVNNHDYLTEYFIREAQKAKDSRVEFKEFFKRCSDVIVGLMKLREKEYNDTKERYEGYKRTALKDNLDIPEIEETLSNLKYDTFSIDLSNLTKDKYPGYVYQKDIDFINTRLIEAIEYLSQNTRQPKLTKKRENKEKTAEKINGRVIALFCSIVHQSGILTKGMDSNPVFCDKVISKFKINAPVRTRQYFSERMGLKKDDKYLKEVKEKILPGISLEIREKIITYINSELTVQDNKKLYG